MPNTKYGGQTSSSDVQIRQTAWEHLGQLKDLEISKYKRLFSLETP
jgi:hypothetical protein